MTTDRDYHNAGTTPTTDAELIAALTTQRDRVQAAHAAYLIEKRRLAALLEIAAPARRREAA
jgi:hypothetical protein